MTVQIHVGGRVKRSVSSNTYPVTFDLDLTLDGSPIHLHLQKNTKIKTNVETLALDKGSFIRKYVNEEEVSTF